MKKVLKADIQEYSNLDSKQSGNIFDESGSIGGTLAKKFVRIDNKYIQDYIHAIQNTDSSYVSYLDDFIKENYDETTGELPLQYVSVLLKDSRKGLGLLDCEVLGSRIANVLKVPTAYNETVWLSNDKKLMSIDFVKPNTELTTLDNEIFEEVDGEIIKHEVHELRNDFSDWERLINAQFKGKVVSDLWVNSGESKSQQTETESENTDTNPVRAMGEFCQSVANRDKCVEQFKKDFVSEYLLRAMILDDADFYPRNVTIIKDNSNHTFRLGPVNDYELILVPSANTDDRMEFYDRNIRYLMEKYPEETLKFGRNFFNAFFPDGKLNANLISQLIEENIANMYLHYEFKKSLTTCIENFDKFYMENYLDLYSKPDAEIVTQN